MTIYNNKAVLPLCLFKKPEVTKQYTLILLSIRGYQKKKKVALGKYNLQFLIFYEGIIGVQ